MQLEDGASGSAGGAERPAWRGRAPGDLGTRRRAAIPETIKLPMGLFGRREGLGGNRYRMREKMFAIGDDSWIDTEDGRHAFKVNGKALRMRDTFVLEGPDG